MEKIFEVCVIFMMIAISIFIIAACIYVVVEVCRDLKNDE